MTSTSKLGILAAALLSASAWAQTGTTAPGNATTAASPAPATSAVVNPNRFDPANSHLRRDCLDDTTKTFKATRECDALRMGGGVAASTTAPSVGTSSSLSSTTTTGTNSLAPSASLAGSPPPATTPPAPPPISR